MKRYEVMGDFINDTEAGRDLGIYEVADLLNQSAATPAQTEEAWPKDGDACFLLLSDGVLRIIGYTNAFADELSFGSLFKTKSAAERARDIRKLIADMRRMPGAGEYEEGKREVAIFCCQDEWIADCVSLSADEGTYFDTIDHAESAISALGDRLNIFRKG